MNIARTEASPAYNTRKRGTPDTISDDRIVAQALEILARRIQLGSAMDAPKTVANYLVVHAGARKDQHREVFTVMYLNSQHNIIDVVDEFTGTLTQTSVYPREIVRSALTKNAAAVVLSHNHPSGAAQPSRADEKLTKTLKEALALVDVRVLDHIITAGGQSTSMAELGLV